MRHKKLFFAFLLGLLLLIFYYRSQSHTTLTKAQKSQSSEKPLSMVFATDLHYLSPKLTDNGSFFTDLIESADGKNMFYIEEITDAFVDKMLEVKPEILILSGDLTFNGEKESHLGFEKKLRKLKDSGIQVLVTTGNHDIERSSAAQFKGDGYEIVETVSKNEFAEIYQDYGLQQSLHKDDNSLSYIYQARKDLWLLFIDANSNGDNKLSDKTLKWIEEMLEEAKTKGVKILSITHQNLLAHNPRFTDGFLISNSSQLQDLFKNSQVVSNFSGHIHIQHIKSGQLTEVITSSLAVSPHQYGIVHYDGDKLDYQTEQLDLSAWAEKNGITKPEIVNFTVLSRDFMESVAKRKFIEFVPKKAISKEDSELAMDTFAQINADYFAGNQVDLTAHEKGIALLEEYYGGFTTSYLETILSEGSQDNHNLSLSISD